MTDTVHIPEHLSFDESVEFIRAEIIKRGGNPDTAYPIAIGDNTENDPGPFQIKLDYSHWPPKKKTVTNDYQAGFYSPGD